jgi:hypothetical protein
VPPLVDGDHRIGVVHLEILVVQIAGEGGVSMALSLPVTILSAHAPHHGAGAGDAGYKAATGGLTAGADE